MQSSSLFSGNQPTADNSSGGGRERLLNRGSSSAYRNYGSIGNHKSTVPPKQSMFDSNQQASTFRTFHEQGRLEEATDFENMDKGSNERVISARNVYLPPQKWYKQLHIPGVFNYRASPHSNAIHTTKYTVINFIFKNLWEQFHRFANIYFLIIPILNFVPAVEAFGKEVGFIPLLFVLSVTMIKDAFEDLRRYRSDREVNRRVSKVYDWVAGSYVDKQWRHIRVGDFVELSCDEVIPADILVLSSTDPARICYIETANIDGETSLKQRQVVAAGVLEEDFPSEHFNPSRFVGELHAEQPHNKIYEFKGYIKEPNGVRTSVDRNYLLLRGCVLRNTTKVAGIVVYAGHETKALLNNSGPRAKRSKLERDINTEIISQVAILAILCISGAIASGIWTARNTGRNITYFPFTSADLNPALEGFIRFWTFLILFQVIIPISLYVTMEIVKFTQIYFLNWDRAMYYAPRDKPFECRALNITEDLGQIQYVFSDKTGTLTENEMEFKCCSIGGVNYPHSLKDEFTKYGVDINANLIMHTAALEGSHEEDSDETDFPQRHEVVETDPVLLTSVKSPSLSEAYIRDFFITMAICNTVVVVSKQGRDSKRNQLFPQRKVRGEQNEENGEGEVDNSRTLENGSVDSNDVMRNSNGGSLGREDVMDLSYEAESPDEGALVEAARAYGYALVSRSQNYCAVTSPNGGLLEFDILHVFEFDSNRKCMSVMVRQRGDSRIMLYTKGADSVIYKKLVNQFTPGIGVAPQLPSDNEAGELRDLVVNDLTHSGSEVSSIESLTNSHIDMYARLGLRTLCLARRVFSSEEYEEWAKGRRTAEIALEDRDQLLTETAYSAETKLELLGCTGIEDRLQDGVPEAIESLRKAGIKVWVLTGDKQETAINIGYSSCHINPSMDLIIINAYSLDHCRMELERYHREFYHKDGVDGNYSYDSNDSILTRIPLLKSIWRKSTCDDPVDYRGKLKALVIDGGTLHYALDPSLRGLFIDVAKKCHSVICCRVSPLQKAAVVDAVKKKLDQMTLAIGDGANDVSMIQKAHVGVGISGREGMQAVMASDFAMARFKFLVRLLLVHGHWSYSRLARMMLYFFYKNVTYAVLIFWFQLFNAFSGSNPIDGINLLIFNLVYTSLPIMVVAVTDQDLRADDLLNNEKFYEQGRCSKLYTRWLFWLTMLDAFYESAVVFFVAFAAYYFTDVGVTEFGFLINISVVIVVSLHLAIETQHWTIVNHVILWGSVAVTFVFNYVYTAIDTRQRIMDTFWIMQMASTRAVFWFVLLLTPVIALLPRLIAKVLEQEIYPSAVMVAREKEKKLRRSRTSKVLVDIPDEMVAPTHVSPSSEEIMMDRNPQEVHGESITANSM